jgi:hypothetical protein
MTRCDLPIRAGLASPARADGMAGHVFRLQPAYGLNRSGRQRSRCIGESPQPGRLICAGRPGKIRAHAKSISHQPIEESVLNKWQRLVRALGALGFLSAFCGIAGQPAYADGSVSSLHMGYGARNEAEFAQFQAVIQQYNASGERFRIESHCQSACTMFLSIRNVCVTPGATLLFHAGGSMQKGIISPARTQQMLSTYNAALRQYVSDNHFMDTFAFHPISGREIVKRFGYPACR